MKVLIASYSRPVDENRVNAQVNAFLNDGWQVETLGFGQLTFEGVSAHHEISEHSGIRQNSVWRLFLHLMMSNVLRYRLLVAYRMPRSLLNSGKFDLLILHDLQLLPMITVRARRGSTCTSRVIQVDLHEFHEYVTPNVGIFRNKFIDRKFRNYHTWLLRTLSTPAIDLITVVSPRIGNHYRKNLGTREPLVIRNCAPFEDLVAQKIDPFNIKLVHHGKAAPNRGLETLINVGKNLRDNISLSLMLTGDMEYIAQLQALASGFPRIRFIQPVKITEVAQKLNQFDAEVIFFPPATNNLKFMSPNKFFEALQGRIAVISGPSPEIVDLINEIGNGLHTNSWDTHELINVLNGLDANELLRFKSNADKYSKLLSSERETSKIIDSINAIVLDR